MKKDNSDNLFSVILIEEMKSRGINISKLANETGISERFIKLIIDNDFEKLPSSPYLHGYIIKISNVIDMDGEKNWEDYFQNNNKLRSSGEGDHFPKNRFSVSRFNKKFLIGFFILVVVIYFVVRVFLGFNVSRGLVLDGFKEDPVISEEKIYTIQGNINSSYQLKINQQLIHSEIDGDFSKVIELSPGFNTVIFKIKSPLKKEREISKEIYYKTIEEGNLPASGEVITTTTTSSIINY